jgi:hypothetical protein
MGQNRKSARNLRIEYPSTKPTEKGGLNRVGEAAQCAGPAGSPMGETV